MDVIQVLQQQVDRLEEEVANLRADKQEIIDNFHAFCHVMKKRMNELESDATVSPTKVPLPDEDGEI